MFADGRVGDARILRSSGTMRAGIFSGKALAPVEELLERVRGAEQMKGASLAREVSVPDEYTVEPPEGTRLAAWGARGAQAMSDANFDKVEALEAWAGERGHTILELAFAWLLGHDAVSSVIAGATTPEQVNTNAATAEWALSPEEVEEVGKLVASLP